MQVPWLQQELYDRSRCATPPRPPFRRHGPFLRALSLSEAIFLLPAAVRRHAKRCHPVWLAQIDEQFTRACGSLDYHLAARLVYTVSSVTPSSRGAGSYRKDTAGRHQYVALRRRQDSDEEQPWSPSSPPAAASEPTTTPQPAAAPPPRAPAPANEALGSGPVSQKETAPSPANEALRSGAASQKERRLPDANKVFLLSLGPFLPYVRAHFSHISPFNSFFQVIIADGESNEDVVIKVTARPPTPLLTAPSNRPF